MDLMKRFYDPTIGRFMQVDPVTNTQENYSTYQYGWNNPILRSDPNGDCPRCPRGQYLKAISNAITVKNLKYATENQSNIASVKIGGGLGENCGVTAFGKEVKMGAMVGYNEVTIGTGGIDYNASAFKISANSTLGPLTAGGELNILNLNINFGARTSKLDAINGNYGISGENRSKSASAMSNGEATMSVSAGPATLGISGSAEALKNTLTGYVQAVGGFVRSVVTDLTNNTFNTWSSPLLIGQFIYCCCIIYS